MSIHTHGSTKRERPRSAFDAAKDNSKGRLDFGKSSIPGGSVYRRRWSEGKSWFWITVRLVILGFILFAIIQALIESL